MLPCVTLSSYNPSLKTVNIPALKRVKNEERTGLLNVLYIISVTLKIVTVFKNPLMTKNNSKTVICPAF